MKESYDLTNYLKGFVIISIIVFHYNSYYSTGFNFGLGYGFQSIFFVLSGYGIYYSINTRLNKNGIYYYIIGKFYLDRIVRIFPLYYIGILIGVIVFNYNYNLSAFSIFGIEEFIPKYWFIDAIIKCYILAIPLYYSLKKLKPIKYFILITYIFLLINVFNQIFPYNYFIALTIFRIPPEFNIMYYNLIFSYFYLFGVGLTLPLIIEKIKDKPLFDYNKKTFLIFPIIIAIFIIFIYLTRNSIPKEIVFLLFYFRLGFIFCSILVVFFFILFGTIKKKFYLPFKKVFINMGMISLPLYLFHFYYLELLENMGFIEIGSLFSFIFIFCFFPLFYIFCFFMNKISLYKIKI